MGQRYDKHYGPWKDKPAPDVLVLPCWELVNPDEEDWMIRTRWITQTANQAIGTGVLCMGPTWPRYLGGVDDVCSFFNNGWRRASQSAQIGFGAL